MHAGRSLEHLTPGALDELLSTAADVRRHPPLYEKALANRVIQAISLGTAFHVMMPVTVALAELGAQVLTSTRSDLGERWESRPDALGALLGASVHGVVTVAPQEWTDLLAGGLSRPLMAACAGHHSPVDTLALLYTIQRRVGALTGMKIAVVGDGTAVSNGVLLGASVAGMTVAIAHPRGYAPKLDHQTIARDQAAQTGGAVLVTEDVRAAVEDADVVVVDAWGARGGGRDPLQRGRHFDGYTVTEELLQLARPGALVVHPGPIEVGTEMDASAAQAALGPLGGWACNRIHVAKALALHTMRESR